MQQNEKVAKRLVGKVKWYSGQKAYGFISEPIAKQDYFIHYGDILSDKDFKCLFENDWVEFEPVNTPKGWKAVKARNIPTPQEELANTTASGGENDND